MNGLIKEGHDSVTYVNIKEGKFLVKNKNGEIENFGGLQGKLKKAEFVQEEYQGKKYEKAKLSFDYNGEIYILQVRTDSGYFRGFCNSLKSGNPTELVVIKPTSKKDDKGKVQNTIFVQQNGTYLKHAFTKDNMGDLPPLDKVEFRGDIQYDNSKQVNYWKNWLQSVTNPQLSITDLDEDIDLEEIPDDLPF
jgi:hypothetical protein